MTALKVERYECPNPRCSRVFTDADDALACCGWMANQIERYQCWSCEEQYKTIDEAAMCCGAEHVWVCSVCGSGYGYDSVSAVQCCRSEKYVVDEAFECNECGKVYADASDADACCATLKPVMKFQCSECGEEYDQQIEAMQCCK